MEEHSTLRIFLEIVYSAIPLPHSLRDCLEPFNILIRDCSMCRHVNYKNAVILSTIESNYCTADEDVHLQAIVRESPIHEKTRAQSGCHKSSKIGWATRGKGKFIQGESRSKIHEKELFSLLDEKYDKELFCTNSRNETELRVYDRKQRMLKKQTIDSKLFGKTKQRNGKIETGRRVRNRPVTCRILRWMRKVDLLCRQKCRSS